MFRFRRLLIQQLPIKNNKLQVITHVRKYSSHHFNQDDFNNKNDYIKLAALIGCIYYMHYR